MSATHINSRTGDRAGFATVVGGGVLLAAFTIDAATGVFGIGSLSSRSDFFAAYTVLGLGAILLAVGLAGTAVTYRRRFGTVTLAGLVSGATGALVVALGATLNVTAASPAEATTGGAVVFGGIALSALAALMTGGALWRIDVTRPAAGLLVAAFVGFVFALGVGEAITAVTGFQLAWSVCGILLGLGWVLFGNYVRARVDAEPTDRLTPVA